MRYQTARCLKTSVWAGWKWIEAVCRHRRPRCQTEARNGSQRIHKRSILIGWRRCVSEPRCTPWRFSANWTCMLARQIEELNIHTVPTLLHKGEFNYAWLPGSNPRPPPLSFVASSIRVFPVSLLPPRVFLATVPFYRLICLFIFFYHSVIPIPTFDCLSQRAVRPILRLLVRKYGSTWWKLPVVRRRNSMTRVNPFVSLSLRDGGREASSVPSTLLCAINIDQKKGSVLGWCMVRSPLQNSLVIWSNN